MLAAPARSLLRPRAGTTCRAGRTRMCGAVGQDAPSSVRHPGNRGTDPAPAGAACGPAPGRPASAGRKAVPAARGSGRACACRVRRTGRTRRACQASRHGRTRPCARPLPARPCPCRMPPLCRPLTALPVRLHAFSPGLLPSRQSRRFRTPGRRRDGACPRPAAPYPGRARAALGARQAPPGPCHGFPSPGPAGGPARHAAPARGSPDIAAGPGSRDLRADHAARARPCRLRACCRIVRIPGRPRTHGSLPSAACERAMSRRVPSGPRAPSCSDLYEVTCPLTTQSIYHYHTDPNTMPAQRQRYERLLPHIRRT